MLFPINDSKEMASSRYGFYGGRPKSIQILVRKCQWSGWWHHVSMFQHPFRKAPYVQWCSYMFNFNALSIFEVFKPSIENGPFSKTEKPSYLLRLQLSPIPRGKPQMLKNAWSSSSSSSSQSKTPATSSRNSLGKWRFSWENHRKTIGKWRFSLW